MICTVLLPVLAFGDVVTCTEGISWKLYGSPEELDVSIVWRMISAGNCCIFLIMHRIARQYRIQRKISASAQQNPDDWEYTRQR